MDFIVTLVILLKILIYPSFQDCISEVSSNGINVTWPSSPPANYVISSPLCYKYERLITRNCTGEDWIPSLQELEPCVQVSDVFDVSRCPPGYHPISNKYDYCYQISSPSNWEYPCYKSGGASVITDLSDNEIRSLLKSLNDTRTSQYFWLPGQRKKLYNPLVWYIPGPNWGRPIESNNILNMRTSMSKNCLLLDIEHRTIITEDCDKEYPSLCFYINDIRHPASCPDGYHAFRFLPDDGTCFGIVQSDTEIGSSFDEFLQSKCPKPMGSKDNNVIRFIFTKIANLNILPNNVWCWFRSSQSLNGSIRINMVENVSSLVPGPIMQSLQGAINNGGTLSLQNSKSLLPCMACEAEMTYMNTELIFEYSDLQNKIYLTIYYPSGLWKYDEDDKGMQCFSNAKGFVKVVDVNNEPFLEIRMTRVPEDTVNAEKVVYEIDPVTNRAAQYWCEGHTKNFSLITTNKIIVNPSCNEEHVFSLVVKMYSIFYDTEDMPDMTILIKDVTDIFGANKVLVMDILEYTTNYMLVLMHLHVDIGNNEGDEAHNIEETFLKLKHLAEIELPKYNYTFVNISSSIYCLATVSDSLIPLDWEMTEIGHIAAPKQFCLQANGLPVKRNCYGSYLLGSRWGDVEGVCDFNYEASMTTKFLFAFVKGNVGENDTSRFLIDGLGFVLGDVDVIIPADIYYLSVSLQHVIYLAQNNHSSIDMGDIDNMVWVMDRVMTLDQKYMRLSQTLNSTNVILDTVGDIIEHLSGDHGNIDRKLKQSPYLLAMQPQFIVQISYPGYNNITGVAIIKNTESDNFTDMVIQPLFGNTSLSEVISLENLEVATWIPNEVLVSLQKYNNESDNLSMDKIHIVISVFHNDVLFQELDMKHHVVNSRILGVSIPGYSSNLEHPVPLVFKQLSTNSSSDMFCGYWNFQTENSSRLPGQWTRKGCFLKQSTNNITVCECYHLTHFGQLLNTGGNTGLDDISLSMYHKKVLNIITLAGSFLSLLGIVGIWITACVFYSWRQKAGTKVLLHLSAAIALPLIFIVVFNLDNSIFIQQEDIYKIADSKIVTCIILGAFLHYSILASFMWMLITAILQFVRYVRVLGVRRPSRFMLKCTVIGWGTPIIPIIGILIIDKENYIPDSLHADIFKGLICYPKGIYLITCVILPICIILLINVVLFLIVMYSIYRGPDGKVRSTDIDLIGAQFRLSIFLFFLLGLTWIFGILSFTKSLVWSYMFCLTSTLQGFVLFIYFVVCDPSTRNLWLTLMRPQFLITRTTQRESVTSISSG